MVKKSKRKQDIKSKLLAAIAMLMVATIMMVSSTYAWFTLSTAPEVQGITTNVGANGNLEIALSPLSGDASDVTSNVGDYNDPWTVKNLTWGNLLDLSDASYGLGNINLLPAQLNLAALGANPLKTPVYGEDGRISTLEANTYIGGLVEGEEGYLVDGGYGVRVVGTSSSMTEYQITFQNNFSAMNTAVKNAHDLAEVSLNANGATLAEIAIAHASVTTDNNNYASYVPALTNMVSKLQESNDELEAAIRAALLATASSDLLGDDADDADAIAAYNAMTALVIDDNTLPEIWAQVSGISTAISGTPIGTAYDVWASVEDDLNNTTDGAAVVLAGLDTNATVGWDAISSVITKLMATNGVTINNMQLGDLKGQINIFLAGDPNQRMNEYKDGEGNWLDGSSTGDAFNADVQAYRDAQALIGTLTRGVELQLGAGSGVYADLASAVGNIHAAVQNVMITVPGMGAVPADVNIDTTTGTDAALVAYKTILQGLGALEVDNSGSNEVIDVEYAYIVDFLFRTNASGSSLKLQTEGAQRIYDDSNNEATQGAGSTMTFYSTALNEQAVKGLMDAMRVVFMDTTSGELLGIAKLDMNEVTTADDTVNGETVKKITANLYLYEYTQDPVSGALTFTNQIAADNQILCDLQANTAKAVSAMVYLDGDYVENEDVAAQASSMTGELNLQFASTATLVPMENSALQNGTNNNP